MPSILIYGIYMYMYGIGDFGHHELITYTPKALCIVQ